jgi:hypothetical protein
VSAVFLRSQFIPLDFTSEQKKKTTNIPKYIQNLLIDVIQDVVIAQFGFKYNRWVDSIIKKFNKNQKQKNTFSLAELLCAIETDSVERKLWKDVHRQELARILACNRLENILNNELIPCNNKMHYLYYSKLYEWRLSNQIHLMHLK